MRIIDSKPVHLMTGPARNPEDDVRMVQDFMDDPNARTIVCGGTSATIVSRVLGKKLDVSLDYVDPEIPPIAYMEGVDLVTEGVLTLNRVLQLLRRYVKNETVSEEFFHELDKPNGGSMVAKVLIEDCTEVHLYVGKTYKDRETGSRKRFARLTLSQNNRLAECVCWNDYYGIRLHITIIYIRAHRISVVTVIYKINTCCDLSLRVILHKSGYDLTHMAVAAAHNYSDHLFFDHFAVLIQPSQLKLMLLERLSCQHRFLL